MLSRQAEYILLLHRCLVPATYPAAYPAKRRTRAIIFELIVQLLAAVGTVARRSRMTPPAGAVAGGRCHPWLFLARSSAASEAHTSDVSRCCKSLAQHELPDKQAGERFKWQGWASSAVARRLHAAQPAREPASRAGNCFCSHSSPQWLPRPASPSCPFLPLSGWGWLVG